MDLRGHLDLLVLATLRHTGPVHGYGLISALGDRSDGTFELPEGTIYPALHRLERGGLVSSSWSTDAPRRRRVYALTAAGKEALAEKTATWRRLSDAVTAVLGRVPSAGTAGGVA
jgi:DNA-binding PadR family transcriptional regulator